MRVETVSRHLRREPNLIILSSVAHVIFKVCLVFITMLRQDAQPNIIGVLFHHALLTLNSVSGVHFVSMLSSQQLLCCGGMNVVK